MIPNPVSGKITYLAKPFNQGKPDLLFIGFTPNKNLQRTIEALKGLSCRLTIVGPIPTSDQQIPIISVINTGAFQALLIRSWNRTNNDLQLNPFNASIVLWRFLLSLQVAQAPFAVLDVRLQHIARISHAAVALVALGKLRVNETNRVLALYFRAVTALQFLKRHVAQTNRDSRRLVQIVRVAFACRMQSSTERVAWPTLKPRSHKK